MENKSQMTEPRTLSYRQWKSHYDNVYLPSNHWKKKREEALEFYGRKCQACGSTESLQVHHLHYKSLHRENVETDLEVLCADCHKFEHNIVSDDIDYVELVDD